jgi:hypothetical protein
MVKKIELTQGQVAIVDNIDFDYLNQWKWCADYNLKSKGYYAMRTKHLGVVDGKRKQKRIRMHRVVIEHIFGRELQRKEFIDHINHDPLDNRRQNLRVVSHRQNLQNQKRKTTSKYPGVCWSNATQKWRAYIHLNGKLKSLGYHSDEREAAKAYEKACRELVGEELVCKSQKVKEES